jgi:hypothetical protein
MCGACRIGKDSMEIQNLVAELRTERNRLDQAISASKDLLHQRPDREDRPRQHRLVENDAQ